MFARTLYFSLIFYLMCFFQHVDKACTLVDEDGRVMGCLAGLIYRSLGGHSVQVGHVIKVYTPSSAEEVEEELNSAGNSIHHEPKIYPTVDRALGRVSAEWAGR